MWPVTSAFLAAHRASTQHVTVRAELWRAGSYQAALTVLTGSVSVDARRSTRRTCTLDVIDPSGALIPTGPGDLLVPTGTQLRIWRGITLPTGETEEVPLGVFRLTEPKLHLNSGGLRINLSGSDESDTVRNARLTTAWTWAAGTPVGQAVLALLTDRHPTLASRDDTNPGTTLGATTVTLAGAESDPWQAAADIAAQYGLEVLIGADGVAVVRPIPNPGSPVITYARGTEAVITAMSRTLTTDTTYSGVCVSSETSDAEAGGAPITVTVWDTNPASPTYYLGPFGARPYFITSQLITTTDQATATATAHLPRVTGVLEQVEWEQVCNPALDAGDLIQVTDPDLGMAGTLLTIEALTIPLGPGPMTAVTRSRTMGG